MDHPEYKSRYQLYGMLQGKSEEVPVRMQSQSVECLPFTKVIEILSPVRCSFYTKASWDGKHGFMKFHEMALARVFMPRHALRHDVP